MKTLLCNNKSKTDKKDRCGLYEISCSNCNAINIYIYIYSQIGRKIKIREHEKSIKDKTMEENVQVLLKITLKINTTLTSIILRCCIRATKTLNKICLNKNMVTNDQVDFKSFPLKSHKN